MVIDDEFEYRSCRVHCSVKLTSNRRYAASVVITRVTPDRLMERHFPPMASFATKREALENARQAGIEWIDAQVQLPPAVVLPTGLASIGARLS